MFLCPVCGEELFQENKSLRCKNMHSYDLSRTGYVNLLLAQTSSKKRHGDDRQMVLSRKMFLDKGYYNPLKTALIEDIREHFPPSGILLDAGCGEGYYTDAFSKAFPDREIYGIDISKDAIHLASKRNSSIRFAVAGITSLPLKDESCSIIVNLFAPINASEFYRVLIREGFLIRAIPLPKHLYELKCAVYDSVYENSIPDLSIDGFSLISYKDVNGTIFLDNNADIENLFKMTPYYYKTGKKDQDKLLAISHLETQIGFRLITYKKEQELSL